MYAGRPVENGAGRRAVRPPADAVHDRPARRGPPGGRAPSASAGADQRQPAAAGRPARGLPVPARAARSRCAECAAEEPRAGAGAAPAAPSMPRPASAPTQIDDGRVDGGPIYPVPPAPAPPSAATAREQRPPCSSSTGSARPSRCCKGALLKRRVGLGATRSRTSTSTSGEGETLGLVGESGCGKTTTLLEIMNLRAPGAGQHPGRGRRRRRACGAGAQERALRRKLQMVFQDPMGALDPRLTVFDILAEPLRAVGEADREAIGTAGRRADGAGRARPRAQRPLPDRVLRRAAPAHRHRPGAGHQSVAGGARRAGLGAGRLDPGRRDQPAERAQGRARARPTSSSRTTCRWCGTSRTGWR